jgi:hypothetical protein
MNEQDTDNRALAAPLAALRHSLGAVDAPPGVEKELMAAFAARHKPLPWYRRPQAARWGLAGGVGSTALVLAAVLLTMHAPVQMGAGALAADERGDFIALQPLARIEAETAPGVLETDVPRAALAPLGVSVTPENAGDMVRAEMLVSADGEPLALRLSMN